MYYIFRSEYLLNKTYRNVTFGGEGEVAYNAG